MNKDQLGNEIYSASQDIASKLFDRLLRERKLIPISVLRDYMLSNREDRKLLIANYGDEPFEFVQGDALWFAGFMSNVLIKSGDVSYPFYSNGKIVTVTIKIDDLKDQKVDVVEKLTYTSNLWINFKIWLKKINP